MFIVNTRTVFFLKLFISPFIRPMGAHTYVRHGLFINGNTALYERHNHVCKLFKDAEMASRYFVVNERNTVMKLLPALRYAIEWVITKLGVNEGAQRSEE